MKKTTILCAALAGVLTLGITSCGGGDMASKIMAARQHGAKPYKTMTVSKSSRSLQTTYSASIKGRQDIDIYPQVGGTLQQLLVKEGQRVSKGQTLFIIDQVPFQAALNVAKANLKAAEAQLATVELTLKSKKTLREQNVISDYELQTAQNAHLAATASVEQCKAAVINAQNSLNYTVVKSPANGVVGTLPYRQGALVGSSMPQPLTTVSDNNEMYVYFSMNETQVLALTRQYGSPEKAAAGMPAIKLLLSDGSEYSQAGRVETISGVVERGTGAVSIRAVFPNPDHLLQSGASGTVVMPTEYNDVIVVPQAATFRRQDKVYVYRITNEEADIYNEAGDVTHGKADVAHSVMIEIEPNNNGTEYIVTKGLNIGDRIIADGAGMVSEGDQVKK